LVLSVRDIDDRAKLAGIAVGQIEQRVDIDDAARRHVPFTP
jgi:hypothetical protein